MLPLKNARFLKALRREAVDRTPVWIMRQAGRYLSEYQAIRSQAGNFLNLCKTPELACAATLLPIKKFQLDAAIIFSDILIIPDAMGQGLSFVADEGPKFSKVIAGAADVTNLKEIAPLEDLAYLDEAIRLVVKELDRAVPLIGFTGSPWTLATYMVEGQTSKQFNKIRGLMYKEPQTMHKLLAHLAQQITATLQMQINAGVDVVMLFDTWGGILADPLYLEFSLNYMHTVVTNLRKFNKDIPIILFTKNGGRCISDIAATGCNAIGLDWAADLAAARALVGDKVALQGNLDPCVLYAEPKIITAAVRQVLDSYGHGSGHIFNLGHGIPADVDPKNLEVVIDAVRKFSPSYHDQTQMVQV